MHCGNVYLRPSSFESRNIDLSSLLALLFYEDKTFPVFRHYKHDIIVHLEVR